LVKYIIFMPFKYQEEKFPVRLLVIKWGHFVLTPINYIRQDSVSDQH
jgi:hypothetical protein